MITRAFGVQLPGKLKQATQSSDRHPFYTGVLTPGNSRTLVCSGFSAQPGLPQVGLKVIVLIFSGKRYSRTTTAKGLDCFNTQSS